jgi:hypothetical protein
MKTDPTPSVQPKKRLEPKTWKRESTPSLPPKTSSGAQIVKTGPDALGTAENDSEVQNMKTGRPWYSRK